MSNFGTYGFPKKNWDYDLTANGTLSLPSAMPVVKGDIVAMSAAGAYGCLPNTYGALAPYTGTLSASTTVDNNGSASGGVAATALLNGNAVVVYKDIGGIVKFGIYSGAGTIVGSLTAVEGGSSVSDNISVTTLTSGNFVIAYRSSSTTRARFAQYTSTGTIVGALTDVDAITGSYTVTVSALTNGNFVVAYRNGSNYAAFGIFSAAGSLVGSLTVIESVAVTTAGSISVAGLTSGNFVVSWRSTNGSLKFAQYTNTGTIVGSITTIDSTTSSYPGVSAVGLLNGNFVVAFRNSVNVPVFVIYTSANTLYSAQSVVDAAVAAASSYMVTTCATTDGFVVGYLNTQARYVRFSTTGVPLTTYAMLNSYSDSLSFGVTQLTGGSLLTCGRDTSPYIYLNLTTFVAGTLTAPVFTPDSAVNNLAHGTSIVATSYSSNGNSVGVAALTNGNTVVTWFDSNGYGWFQIFNQYGLQQGLPFQIDILSGSSQTTMAVAPLASGNFVVVWRDANFYPKFAVFSNTGATVVVPTVAYASACSVSGGTVAVSGLASGNFVILFCLATATPYPTFIQYTSGGTLVGSVTTVANTDARYGISVAGLTNGGFVTVFINAGSGYRSIYSSSGVIILGSTVVVSGANDAVYYQQISVAAIKTGGYVIANRNGTSYPGFAVFDNSGNQVGSATIVESLAVNYGISVAGTNTGFVVSYQLVSGTQIKFAQFTSAGALIGTIVSTGDTGGNFYSVKASATPVGNIVVAYPDSNAKVKFGTYTGQIKPIHGVALNNTNAGENVLTRYIGQDFRLGQEKLNTTVNTSIAFDHRSIGGIAGNVVGNTSVLKGFSA